MSSIGILGTGSYLPDRVVTNDEVAGLAGVTDEWIVRKTGIRERRRAADREATSDLAAVAARRALAQADVPADQIHYIVLATSTPDHPQPATASIVQHLVGASNAAAFDINAVCAGFVYALAATERLLRADGGHALVIGADIYSRILDYTDRKTAVLFGDGAGAAVLGPVPDGHGLLQAKLVSRGDQHDLISVPAGGSRLPSSIHTVAEGKHYFRMDGRAVRTFVKENLPAAVADLLRCSDTPASQIRHFVPHQANGVMINEIRPVLGCDDASLHLTLGQYGNTGAASVPTTLDDVNRRGLLERGDLMLLAGFGGGMSVGAALMRWAVPRCEPVAAPGGASTVLANVNA